MGRILNFSLIFLSSFTANASANFYYYDQADRVEALEDIYKTVKGRYSLWDLKKTNMGIDGDKLFRDAIAFEFTVENVQDSFSKAKSNIDFHGRVKKLIASFKDTHFGANENVTLPTIISGLQTATAVEDGKNIVLVTGISQKIINFNAKIGGQANYSSISLGDQVISIDGLPVEKVVAKLSEYIDGSSPGYIRSQAAMNLSYRNFAYPEKNFSQWEFKKQGSNSTYTVRLPWYGEKTVREDAKLYFDQINIRSLGQVYYSWNQSSQMWEESQDLEYKGHNRFDAPAGLVDIKEWLSGSRVILRTGYFIKNGKSYGYAQLFSYTNSTLYPKTSDVKSSGRSDKLLKEFIQELKNNKTPLIFDLRVNFGGNTAIAINNLSALAKANETYPSRTVVFRTSQFMQSMFSSFGHDPSLADEPGFYDFERTLEQFYLAVDEGREYTNIMLQTPPITADEQVGGYELPVVALISPWCISACDNQAFLMETSNRVTLVGQPANGTGAGFWGGKNHVPTFTDSFFISKMKIPNYLFGLPIKTDDMVLVDNTGDLLAQTNSENKPTKPHIKFDYTAHSYLNNSEDWINKAVEVIDKKSTAQKQEHSTLVSVME